MKNKYIYIGVGLLIVLVALYYKLHPLTPVVRFSNVTYTVELAVTDAEKMKGLSGRKELAPDHGMLFLYDHSAQYPYWMKDMNIPLDFIWMFGNMVVDVTENVPPTNTIPLPVITPKAPVDKVLEVNAGDIAKYNIKIGDSALFR